MADLGQIVVKGKVEFKEPRELSIVLKNHEGLKGEPRELRQEDMLREWLGFDRNSNCHAYRTTDNEVALTPHRPDDPCVVLYFETQGSGKYIGFRFK